MDNPKTYCRIEDGVVVDAALFDGNMPRSWPDYDQWKLSHTAQIGWSFDGNTFHPPVIDVPTPTEDDYRRAIQRHVDEAAQARNYDGGNSLASYKDSTIPQWSSEAVAFIAWRDQVWFYAYAELSRVMAGEREHPSVEEFIAELPSGARHLKLIKDGKVIATYRNHGFDMIEPLADDDAPAA